MCSPAPSAFIVSAAIALWNTVYLGRALDILRRGEERVPDTLLAHLASFDWQHINLTGDYLWDADRKHDQDGFRPLRTLLPLPPAADGFSAMTLFRGLGLVRWV